MKNNKKLTTEEFISRSKAIYGDKYDYSLVKYIDITTKVKIIYNGVVYEQRPVKHLMGRKCEDTSTKKLTTEEFISRSKDIYVNKYDYSLVKYINNSTKVKLIYEDIIYEQLPANHLKGFKCENIKGFTKEEFITKSMEIHGNKYDYSLLDFKNVRGRIKLICNGVIYEQTAYGHLSGKSPEMLGIIRESKGSRNITKFLEKNKIEYIKEHSYPDCKNIFCLKFDFYLPKLGILIEYDGIQHFKPVSKFGGEKGFISRQKNDGIKNDYCNKNRIPLLRISYLENVNIKMEEFFKISNGNPDWGQFSSLNDKLI